MTEAADRDRLAALHGVDVTYSPSPDREVRVPDGDGRGGAGRARRRRLDPGRPCAPRWPSTNAGPAADCCPRSVVTAPAVRCGTRCPRAPAVGDRGGRRRGVLGRRRTAARGRHVLRAQAPDGRTARAQPRRGTGPAARSPGTGHRPHGPALLAAVPRSWGMGDLGDLGGARRLGRAGRSARASSRSTRCTRPCPAHPTDPSPVPALLAPLPRPGASAGRGGPRVRRTSADGPRAARRSCWRKAAALRDAVLRQGRADRPGRGLGAQARGARSWSARCRSAPGRRAAYVRLPRRAGPGPGGPRHLVRARRAARPRLARAGPTGLRDPRSAAGRAGPRRAAGPGRLPLLAGLADRQPSSPPPSAAARDAGMAVGIVHDLAVGVHPAGADAWAHAGRTSPPGMSVGAPPDAFNARGQDWGLPPWRPDALAATGYAPYRDLLRGAAAARGRPAHRPRDGPVPALVGARRASRRREGTYVRYDAEAMLGVLALEAHAGRRGRDRRGPGHGRARRARGAGRARRARHVGAVVRAGLGRRGPARRRCRPERWRADCLATATTHDLPTTAARLTGEHVELRHRLGLLTRPLDEERAEDAAEVAEWLALLGRLGLLPPRAPGDEEAVVQARAPLPAAHPGPDGRRLAAGRGRRPPPAEPAGHLGPVPELAAARSRTRRAARVTLESWPPRRGCTRWSHEVRAASTAPGRSAVRHPRARGPRERSLHWAPWTRRTPCAPAPWRPVRR